MGFSQVLVLKYTFSVIHFQYLGFLITRIGYAALLLLNSGEFGGRGGVLHTIPGAGAPQRPGHPGAGAPWPLLLKPTMLILTKSSISTCMVRQPIVGGRQAITFPIMGQPC